MKITTPCALRVLCLSTRSYITDCLIGYPPIWGNPTVDRADGNVCAVKNTEERGKSESSIRINCKDKNAGKCNVNHRKSRNAG
jgi:hypothetical protein